MITSGAVKNVEFYADVLGLRMIKKTINFDAPDAYHLYFGDEHDLPSQHERLRPQLERLLTPLTNPRTAQRAEVQS